MKSVKVEIKGLSQLLMHSFPLVPIEAIDKKSPAEQAELAAYRDPETRDLYVSATAVQRCLVSGATYSKGKGRGSLQKNVAACVQIGPQERLSLGTKEYVIDSRPVVVPATKGRVVRHRPRLETWALSFTIEYDERLLTEAQMRRIVDDSGSRVGLLDFRPEKKGPFGRFMVTKWDAS
jgi:hypothetical protein